ncbi:hypothetical protein FEE96_20590 [Parasedimentitalea maritima]|uniref:Uncharacterized protein n=1 Tax=Parasedimentitalea maritima TaxID=2578117 RepID=A0ABY2UQ38_9RHOB|nr:hypothetical protein [Zongyanglinia marina]TLP56836.1 hypothetical protein FEE96_20590 [Zongyanglinia marina]
MTKLGKKIRHSQLFEMLRQKNASDQVNRRLQVSRRSDGEGKDTLMLRTMAERSLIVPSNGRV